MTVTALAGRRTWLYDDLLVQGPRSAGANGDLCGLRLLFSAYCLYCIKELAQLQYVQTSSTTSGHRRAGPSETASREPAAGRCRIQKRVARPRRRGSIVVQVPDCRRSGQDPACIVAWARKHHTTQTLVEQHHQQSIAGHRAARRAVLDWPHNAFRDIAIRYISTATTTATAELSCS